MSDDRASLLSPSERLRAWLDDVQLSARLGTPQYANPGELKDDLHVVLDTLDLYEEALRAIHADDPLVMANEDAFSVHAYRRCQQTATFALTGEAT